MYMYISPGKTLVNTTALVLGNSIHTHAYTRRNIITLRTCSGNGINVYGKIARATKWLT